MLWDVDFTLVIVKNVGRHLYELAFEEIFGRELPAAAQEARMAGRTDRAIVLDVLALAGIPDPAARAGEFEAVLARLAPGMEPMAARSGTALPGAAAAIEAFAALDGAGPVRQSLLTGNIRPLAEAKLAPFGLTGHLDLDIGAYGDEHAIRAELVHLARDRAARAYGEDFSGQATVLIGDTPLDVEAALASGARAVAVATGFFSAGDLAAAGAHAVIPDLTDPAAVISAAALQAPRALSGMRLRQYRVFASPITGGRPAGGGSIAARRR